MKVHFFSWITFGALVGGLLGFQFSKGKPQGVEMVAVVGALLGLVGFFAVSAVHKAYKLDTSKTDHVAIIGSMLGAICGGVIGAFSGFGRLLISIFNPDLMERDWGAFFGGIGGICLGAFLGACLVSAITPLLRRRKTAT
ncbi:hypothetical protein OAG56_03085 [Mariniblastus sp.]|jgi:uncharacterized protein YcfJ|nr:hypothetical protein [Mariniblastus sp.]MDB4756332.1 hypothetical protein [Mariniblastus sp.]